MIVTQAPSIYVAPVGRQPSVKLAEFVTDKKHQIAMTGDLAKPAGLRSLGKLNFDQSLTLQAISTKSPALTTAQRLALAKAVATAGTATLPIIKPYFPGTVLAIEGFEFVFSTTTAVQAWCDPERTSAVRPLLKTSRALVELFDLLKLAVPAFEYISPQVQAITLFIKVGDTLFQFYTDLNDLTRAGKGK